MLSYLRVNCDGYFKISKRAVHALVNNLKKELKLNISSIIINFITEKEILRINNEYLDHNYPTDIITFDYSDNTGSIDGELYISYKEAEHNAERYRVTVEEESARLIIHGILHLAGYNDEKEEDKRKMKLLENKLLKKYKHHIVK